jgi:hypothetical protein
MQKLMRNFFSVVLAVAGATAALGVDNPPAATPPATASPAEATNVGPKIQFAMPVYDFGKVQAGEVVKYGYVFTNTGDQVLEVTAVQPSCGCTTAGDWTHRVAPGETGKVAIQFNSANFNGQVFKTVSVTSNDKQKPTMVLQLKGSVWKPLELIPQYTVLNIPPDAPNTSAMVRIVNHLEEPLMVFSPECSNRSFNITFVTNQPGKEYQLTLASAGELKPGNIQGKVTLKTSSAKTPTLDVPFWVNIQPAVAVVPQRISLPVAPLKAKFPATVTIQNNSTNGLTLSDAVVNVPGVDVQIKEVQPGRVFTAALTFPEGFEAPVGSPLALSVKSSQARMPEIKIPIVQLPRPAVPSPALLNPPPNPPPLPSAPTATKPTASIQGTH